MVRMEKQNGVCRLHIDGDMTIYHAAMLKRELLDRLAECSEAEIDLSQVTEMDSAGLQVLFLARRELASLNRHLRVVLPSPVAREVLELSNTTAFFEIAG